MSFQHDAKWFFVKEDPNDRGRSTSRRHLLEGAGLSTEARVAREAIQNSVDATLGGEKTDVSVRSVVVSGEAVSSFRDLIGFGDGDSPFARLDKLGLKSGNAYEHMCRGGVSSSFRVTVIEDYNTCGLGYDERDGKDRFDELCLSFGQDTTSASGSRGGSYGFGKEVYEEASDCNTFMVYSVFAPSEHGNEKGSHARLFGCATFDGHEGDDGIKYKGRALFGFHRESASGSIECRPLVDEMAHEVAGRLGFEVRDQEDTGTSIMIFGSSIDMGEFKKATEDYWWPRIHSNQLSVDLMEDCAEFPPPDPRRRSDLEPYVRCYSLIEEGVPKEDGEREIRLRTAHGSKPGSLALKSLPPDETEDDEEGDLHLKNTVALVRSGPRMVVQYMEPGGSGAGSFVGTFVSHSESEEALHLSEPPAHNVWDHNSQRLRDAYPNDPEKGETAQKLVKSIVDRIRRQARDFRRQTNSAPPPPVDGTRKLASILERVMSGRGLGPRPAPVPNSDPFELNIREGRENTPTQSSVTATVKIELRYDADEDSADVKMSLRPTVVIDDNMRRDTSERIALESVKVDGKRAPVSNDFDVNIRIFKYKTVVVEAKSEKFDRELYASLDVEVEAQRQFAPSQQVSVT